MPTTFTSILLDRFLQPKSQPNSSSNNMHTISSNSPSKEEEEEIEKIRDRNEIVESTSPPDYSDFFDPQESMSVASSLDAESERFFDPRETMSLTTSSVEAVEDVNNVGSESYASFKLMMNSPKGPEFVEAIEEHSSEGSPRLLHRDVTAELRKIRRSLLMEIDSRKQAEEARDIVQTQWERLVQRLSLEGLTLPTPSITATADEKSEADPVEELCQQISIVRAVSTSVGRETAKAEAEIELESEINSKNFEITRLSQRLHYYEVVNSEMSLRNQETVEIERTRRQKRKRKQRWIWSSIGVSLVLGSMALAWSFLPTDGGSIPTDTSHAPEVEGAANVL